jgi:nicotinate-nucleotide adenylyltransferase
MFAPRQKIGLLGGSFNPAHAGHVHLSIQAKKRLGLDKIVWLVSPQNPLKRAQDIAPYETRFSHAQALTAKIPAIEISDFEQKQGLFYSLDTISVLQRSFPRSHFVWLMGADNLACFHRWRDWRAIMARIPIAVFDRAPFAHAALRAPAALSHSRHRIDTRAAKALPASDTPVWCYQFMPRHPQSATDLRKMLGKDAFL